MSYTILIKHARVIDGTGAPAFMADVALDGARIARIAGSGELDGAGADTVIDAAGKVLCPGFIELHTHYDPQLCWDRTASPAAEHGVTTVVVGNCSLSLAPVRPDGRDKITRMYHRIEDLAPEFFSAAVPYHWESFSELMDSWRQGLGINVGAVVGHSTLRHYVMGAAAQERQATGAEIDTMCTVLHGALQAGAFGLSLSYGHVADERGVPVASSWAGADERLALARVVAASGRRYVQSNINLLDSDLRMAQIDELAQMALDSGVSCTALGVMENPISPDQWHKELERVAYWRAQGARLCLETQVRPLDLTFKLAGNWILAYYMPAWAAIMGGTHAERLTRFADPALRAQLHADTATFASLFECIYVRDSGAGALAGRRLSEIARERGSNLTDAMLDIAVQDGLDTLFDWRDAVHANVDVVAAMLDHPAVRIGGSDAGAHITQFCGEGDGLYLLQHYVRTHGRLSLERAIHRLTGELADDFGVADRGVIAPGKFADLVLFDPDSVGRGAEFLVHDVPGDGGRYVRRAAGIDKVLVNGAVLVDRGGYSTARSGVLV